MTGRARSSLTQMTSAYPQPGEVRYPVESNDVHRPCEALHRPVAPQTYRSDGSPDVDGFRRRIFENADNSTVVISDKGTPAG